MTYEYNLKEKKLNLHETFPSYSDAEKKFSNSENQVNNLRNFIITKTKDMNYEEAKHECKKLVEDINKTLVKTKWLTGSQSVSQQLSFSNPALILCRQTSKEGRELYSWFGADYYKIQILHATLIQSNL